MAATIKHSNAKVSARAISKVWVYLLTLDLFMYEQCYVLMEIAAVALTSCVLVSWMECSDVIMAQG